MKKICLDEGRINIILKKKRISNFDEQIKNAKLKYKKIESKLRNY